MKMDILKEKNLLNINDKKEDDDDDIEDVFDFDNI